MVIRTKYSKVLDAFRLFFKLHVCGLLERLCGALWESISVSLVFFLQECATLCM